jgi:hypothetical protein
VKIFYGWRMAGAACGIQFMLSGLLGQAFGAYVAVLSDERGWSKTALSGAAALQSVESAIMGPALGWLMDRFGTRNLVTAGIVIFACAFAALSQIDSLGGFYVNDQSLKAPLGTVGIMRNNASVGLYRWTQNSIAEHQLSTLMFGAQSLHLLAKDQIERFDVLLPISIIAAASAQGLPAHRSRYILQRVKFGHFHRHYDAYRKATEKGFWAQHYELPTNYNHELNALFDVHHESSIFIKIIDQVSGHSLPAMPPIDPAVHAVNGFIGRIRPIYRLYKNLRKTVTLGAKK